MRMDSRDAGSHPYSPAGLLSDRDKNLLRYYIECARQDEGQLIRVFPNDAGKRFILWPSSPDLWHLDATDLRILLGSDQFRFANELKRTPAAGALLYGYPMHIDQHASVVPLFTWSIEYELHGQELLLYVMPEWPQMNPAYLTRMARTTEEQREVLDSLGNL